MLQVNSLNLPWFGSQQPRGEPRRKLRARADTRHYDGRVESHARGPVVWVAATSGWTSEEAPCTGRHTALWRITGPRWSITHEVPWFGWQQPRGEPRRMLRARADTRHCGDRVESHARGPVVWVAATSGWTSEEAPCMGRHTALRRITGPRWSITHEVPWFGWQQPLGEPRRMHRARGVRRGLGAILRSWDESAVRVERKRWSYLGVSPEVAVCLVATTATQAGRVESQARGPVVWVPAASRWSSEEASCTGIALRTRANSRSKCRRSREKAMIIPRS